MSKRISKPHIYRNYSGNNYFSVQLPKKWTNSIENFKNKNLVMNFSGCRVVIDVE